MDFTSDQDQYFKVFFPYAMAQRHKILTNNLRFVHYTSAETAVSILTGRRMWMRRTSVMNDYMEFEYGKSCVAEAIKSDLWQRLRTFFDGIRPGLLGEVVQRLEGWIPIYKMDTFLTCISEHLPEEDNLGRLSMWRAYGGTTGVALVLNNGPFLGAADVGGPYTSPVAYADKPRFLDLFRDVVESIEAHEAYVKDLGHERVFDAAFLMLRNALLCTKHPGFHEEREWRVIYTHHPGDPVSLLLELAIVTTRGVPQQIFKIILQDLPATGLIGIEPAALLDHVIIGPSQYPFPMYDAFVRLLSDMGVPDPWKKVVVSDIPLRQ